jgi:hypothetical protein
MVELHPKARKIELPAGENGRKESAMQNQNQNQNQRPFTTEDTENTEKSKTIIQQRAEALVRRIGETCDELDRLAEENPGLVGRVARGAEEHKDAYVRLKARLELADEAPRCRWVKQDGTACRSPQMKKHIYCFAHRQMMEARALALSLPAQEDANAIQIGIMRIQKALIEDTISTKKAGLLLYSMQLALQNVGQTTFGQAKAEELVRATVDEEVAFSENQTPTTEPRRHGGEPGKEKPLPLMNADSCGSAEEPKPAPNEPGWEEQIKPVEWKPTPDMYRMDTREGREAYEASFRMKIKPGSSGEQRPLEGVIAPDDPSQVHAVLG